MPGNAPLLKGSAMPIFLGGFLPEAVEAAQVRDMLSTWEGRNDLTETYGSSRSGETIYCSESERIGAITLAVSQSC